LGELIGSPYFALCSYSYNLVNSCSISNCIDSLVVQMKVRVVCRKIYDYIRYDLKEIAFPSSLPDPPHMKKRRKLTRDERIWVWV